MLLHTGGIWVCCPFADQWTNYKIPYTIGIPKRYREFRACPEPERDEACKMDSGAILAKWSQCLSTSSSGQTNLRAMAVWQVPTWNRSQKCKEEVNFPNLLSSPCIDKHIEIFGYCHGLQCSRRDRQVREEKMSHWLGNSMFYRWLQ
jgi:hypothetical protein